MDKELAYQGNKIFYRIIGNGNPVILLHGFGEDSEIWNNQVEFLKDKFRLIVPDLPGSGRSTMDHEPWTMDRFAEVIKAIVDAVYEESNLSDNFKTSESSKVPPPAGGGFRGALIGHSMGGYITLAFAEKYPGYLRSFGLFHSSAFADNEEKKATRRKGIEFIQKNGSHAFLETAIPNLFAPDSKTLFSNTITELISKSDNFLPTALVSYYEAMMQRPDRTHVLKETQVPVLFIMGEHDNAVPLQDVLKQCHIPEKAYIHILHRSGHMGMLEELLLSNSIIEKFLRDTINNI